MKLVHEKRRNLQQNHSQEAQSFSIAFHRMSQSQFRCCYFELFWKETQNRRSRANKIGLLDANAENNYL